MTTGNRECKVQVHTVTRACTSCGVIGACTCTKPALRSLTNRNHRALPFVTRERDHHE
jgi:hypothetical protein